MSYIVLARKYRPQTFSEVYSQDHIVRIFKNAVESDRLGQAYLFTGSRGVGKTSVARILAKSINCEVGMSITPCNKCENCLDITASVSPDVIEIDGASNTGVDDVRLLQKELLYATSQSRYKIIIIDEVHMLSKNAFNALLKTLEEPPSKVVFIFATTEPHKVLPTIISRCQRFDFKRIPAEMIVKRLKEISQIENLKTEDEALYLIAKKAEGGMRDALSLMDQVISYGLEIITAKEVQQIFGLIDFDVFNNFMSFIYQNNPSHLLQIYMKLADNGIDIQEFINNFLEYLRQFLFIKLNIISLEVSKGQLASMQELASKFTEDEIMYMLNFLIETKNNLRTSASPEVLAELTFVKLAKISEMKSLKTILDTIANNKLTYQETRCTHVPPPVEAGFWSPAPNTPTGQSEIVATDGKAGDGDIAPTEGKAGDEDITPTVETVQNNLQNIISSVESTNLVSATLFKSAKLKDVHNNRISFIFNSETGYTKINGEKSFFENIFSKYFNTRVLLAFEYIPEVTNKQTKNATIQEIENEAPELAKFIQTTDSSVSPY